MLIGNSVSNAKFLFIYRFSGENGKSLALYLFVCFLWQVFPGELLSATDMDPDNPGQVIGHTEVKRREVYMKKLEVQFSESHPVLVQLVSQCLHNNPHTRPSSEQLLGRLCAVKTEVEKMYGGNMGRQLIISNVLLVKEMKMNNKRIEELQVKLIFILCIVK